MSSLFNAIVVTCSDQESANSYQNELELRQKKLMINPDTVILCVVDPKQSVGSGGATFNAIFNITEHLSALQGCTVISLDVLKGIRVLICHMGTTTPYSACGNGFMQLPGYIETKNQLGFPYSGLATIFDIMLQTTINILAKDSPPGFWVCSCDKIISLPTETQIDWSDPTGVRLFTTDMDISQAANQYGAVKIGQEGIIEDIIYKGSHEDIQCCLSENNVVPVVSGVAFLATAFVDTLLNMSVGAPLDNYTYLSLDDGTQPCALERPLVSEKENILRLEDNAMLLSLYYDVFLCMAANVTKDDYINGKRGGIYGTQVCPEVDDIGKSLRKNIRVALWGTLRGAHLKAETLQESTFRFMSHDPAIVHDLILECSMRRNLSMPNLKVEFRRDTSPLLKNPHPDREGKNQVFVNSYVKGATIGNKCVLLHSNIEGDYHINDSSMVINITSSDLSSLPRNFSFPENMVLESLHIKMENELDSLKRVFIIFGMNDQLQKTAFTPGCTLFNKKWDSFFERTCISPAEVWSSGIPDSKRCILNAKLFPVYHPAGKVNIKNLLWLEGSLEDPNGASFWRSSWKFSLLEILNLCDPNAEFSWRRELYFSIGQDRLKQSLHEKSGNCFIPFFQYSNTVGYFERTLAALDSVAADSSDPAVLSRCFACIADVLGAKAGGGGGLRSGPAANLSWQLGLQMIKDGRVAQGVAFMAEQRKLWLKSPALLVRAARHYEGAFQIQVRKAVATARHFIKLTKKDMVAMDRWVTAACSARADIAGTWSDTPPICYEQGGHVIMLALQIDGKKPLGCKVRRIPEPKITLFIGENPGLQIECHDFLDLMSFSQPNVPGALLKAAFFCTQILPLENPPPSLAEYLSQMYGGGFVLQTWSNLPYGSGLGTSSILAGVIISALWTLVGQQHDNDSVIHAVLDLEQLLTTGGGWQDQVGGLCPGVKSGKSANKLPLQVVTDYLHLPPGFKEKIEKHTFAVFTGKTRLARNMLQDVLRNWNARSQSITDTARKLLLNAKECEDFLLKGDLEGVGKCISDCWSHKKVMAHGCEPSVVQNIMRAFEPHVYGQSLLGAGGGGFMIAIAKDEDAFEILSEELKKLEVGEKASVHRVFIDNEGLVVNIEKDYSDYSDYVLL